jgi:hypothetical protein
MEELQLIYRRVFPVNRWIKPLKLIGQWPDVLRTPARQSALFLI